MIIINLTQHQATPEQVAAGVVDLPPAVRDLLLKELTFDTLPSAEEIEDRAAHIAALAMDFTTSQLGDEMANAGAVPRGVRAMIGGAPYLMSALEAALLDACIQPVYAFSVRESIEEVQPDGSVRKINVFRHGGFVEVRP